MAITVANSVITFNDATTQSTAAVAGVTSAVAGNGVAVSGSTGAVTFSVASPSFNTVGSYVFASFGDGFSTSTLLTSGGNYSAGGGNGMNSANLENTTTNTNITNNLSGTWKWMAAPTSANAGYFIGLACRVA
jgi:hypothetical protein